MKCLMDADFMQMPAGWWFLPAAVLGTAVWAAGFAALALP